MPGANNDPFGQQFGAQIREQRTAPGNVQNPNNYVPGALILNPQAEQQSFLGSQLRPENEEQLKIIMGNRAKQLTEGKVERYKPQNLSARNVDFQRVDAARVNLNKQVQEDYLKAVQQAQSAAQQQNYIDPKMQQYLEQSMALNQGVLAGTAPSLATSQLRAGVDEGIRAQMAMAASGGMNPAAMRGAQQQGALSLQQAANQASAIRAQEIAQARAQQQAAYENAAQMTLAGSQFQTQAQQNALAQYLSAQQNYAGMEQERALQNAQLLQQANLQNQQLGLQTQQFNVQQQYDVAKMNEMMRAQEFEQYMANQYNRQALGANYYNTILTGQNAGAQLQQQRDIAGQQMAAQKSAENKQLIAAGLGAAATVGAAWMMGSKSDKNSKKNIKENNETMAFLNALTDNTYKYKEPYSVGAAPGKQYGPMAQDLEKTNMGKTAVVETEHGKMVDTNRAMLLALSGLSNINARLNKLEGNKRA